MRKLRIYTYALHHVHTYTDTQTLYSTFAHMHTDIHCDMRAHNAIHIYIQTIHIHIIHYYTGMCHICYIRMYTVYIYLHTNMFVCKYIYAVYIMIPVMLVAVEETILSVRWYVHNLAM